MRSSLNVRATLVADEFIDRYMPSANGEYVKVYLYLLRHQDRDVTVVEMADALNHTESDIRRAVSYWERTGVLERSDREDIQGGEASQEKAERAGRVKPAEAAGPMEADIPAEAVRLTETAMPAKMAGAGEAAGQEGSAEPEEAAKTEGQVKLNLSAAEQNEDGSGEDQAEERYAVADTRIPTQRTLYTPEQVKKLGDDEDFTQLLYIAQKYMNKVFTPRECEVFAYLYDGLKMPTDLLEYLVEYCVRGGHYSIRYLETVALNWHEKGIRTVEAARRNSAAFTSESFSVMKAFGLNDRRPGDSEQEMIRKWFLDWGFAKELVMEACGRTLRATQKPSFAYADKILEEWKRAGVRKMSDVAKLDEVREVKSPQPGGKAARAAGGRNRFHNFEQRDTNYDAIALDMVKKRLGEQ